MVALASFQNGDVYIDYPFESVMFRFDRASERYFRRFYGENEQEIDHSNGLLRDAIAAGHIITAEQYDSPE